ncbi:hypothetical protein SPURM210S_07882 [Streptomyces purpurascens]
MIQQGARRGEVGVRVDRGHVGGGPALLAGEQRGDAAGAVRRGELDAQGFGRAALVGHDGDAVGEPGAGRLVPAVPLVAGLPCGHHAHAVGSGAQRHPPGHAVQDTALGVGGLDDVDRLGPPVEGPVHVGDPAGPQQREQGAEAEVAGDAGRVAQADRHRHAEGVGRVGRITVEPLGAADDHRTRSVWITSTSTGSSPATSTVSVCRAARCQTPSGPRASTPAPVRRSRSRKRSW